ncbi:Lrp/AsnC family transcriptional regulator [Shewanella japonica]|uniref:Lrp/AsnC family transcriptional regulator n=2 Tax=Shewanellaceae TaxID=267890 RepID=UPI000E729BAA|nr:Lrp/AsnC family transcriptional regulator [Shewanella japonica]
MMDKKDRQLLNVLQHQGRIAISELANQLNMSDTPCLRRVKKLEQQGVIIGYGAHLEPKKLDLNVVVYAFIRLKENSDNSARLFESTVAQLPQVMACSVVTGAHDYLLKIVAADLLSYEQFVKSALGSIDCVAGIESTVVLKQNFSRTVLPI